MYSIGLGSLEREFDGLLRQTFRPIDDATLIRLMDQKGAFLVVFNKDPNLSLKCVFLSSLILLIFWEDRQEL